MANVMKVKTSTDPYLGALEWGGYVWTDDGVAKHPVTVRYYLADDAAAWNPVEGLAMAQAMSSWANVANIMILRTTDPTQADLIEHMVPTLPGAWGQHDTPADAHPLGDYAHGYYERTIPGSDLNDGLSTGGFGYTTMVHEIGHGLGLAHPFDDGGGSKVFPGVTGEYTTGPNGFNQSMWTVMSYAATQDAPSANFNHDGEEYWYDAAGNSVTTYGYNAGPMAFDIAAIQDLYGANTTYHKDNDTYYLPDANAVGTYWSCIWDAGGTDTIAYTGARNTNINLNAATLTTGPGGGGYISWADGIHGGYTIAHGVVIENATGGSGNDKIDGNYADNKIDGGAGADIMVGGAGSDTYWVDNIGDVVSEMYNDVGYDVVISSINYTMVNTIERLDLSGTAAISGTGNELGNTINGNSGDNIINGMAGADTMTGGRGNDIYYVDNSGDKVIEYAGSLEGTADRVASIIDYTLPSNVEQLVLQGSAIFGTGNADANLIQGTIGFNIIDGKGGADTMKGGGGDDIYYVDNSGDKVIEYAGSTQDNDVVIASIDYYQMTDNVETLYLVGSVGSIGVGNGGNNTIFGNDQVNIIDGGLGKDTMTGRGGNDFYIVDNVDDKIVEDVGGGYDTLNSYVNYTAPANVEKVYLVGPWAFNATGGIVNNEIYGNELKNILDGGKGSDMLQGGGDSDTFVFHRGEANGDLVLDFNGNGAGAGDRLEFVGYSTSASFVKVDNTHWQINDGTLHETIVFTNAAAIHISDYHIG